MKVLIVEDERMAAERLRKLLLSYSDSVEVLGQIDSVKNAANWLLNNPPPDLLLLDIHLGDGVSFELFELVDIECPVIFITAYNEYAIQAFKVNSVDYILKPLEQESLYKALDKYQKLFGQTDAPAARPEIGADVLRQLLDSYGATYKNRFMIKVGEHLKAVAVKDILFFFSRDKGTYAITNESKKHLLDYTLDQVDKMLDPAKYFRISRQYLVSFEAIQDIVVWSNSRLRLVLVHGGEDHKEVIVSREKVNAFKEWLDG
jgi:two-component system, LytTR family, response regulator